jgi:threonine/homoserine/homoserine lactone efflux protein
LDARLSLISILGALLVGVVSPGPSFVLVARTAVAVSRRDGLAAALGMGLGGALFGTLALFGLAAVLAQAGWLYVVLKIAGGAYLVYLGISIWRGAGTPIAVPEDGRPPAARPARSFSLGLATQVSNPKTAIVYASVFAALMPAEPPLWFIAVLPPLLFLVEAGWYAVVALAFSAGRPRAAYLRAKAWIDRLAGGVMGALGLRLILDAGRAG